MYIHIIVYIYICIHLQESEEGLSELESDEEMPELYDPAAVHKYRKTSSGEVY